MSTYYPNFTYLGKNSADEGFIVVSFEPDSGFTDTFLGMDQVCEDYYDGTKKFLYGTKYNTYATISVTIIKADGSDFTVLDNRRALKWLTGARTASWFDLCSHQAKNDKDELVWVPMYSFLGTVTSPQQYKVDGRVIGLSFEFASLSPWAYSVPQEFNRSIAQSLHINVDGVLYVGDDVQPSEYNKTSIDVDGTLCNGPTPLDGSERVGDKFSITSDGIVYIEDGIDTIIDNKTDDKYSYIYLDIEFENKSCQNLTIRRVLMTPEEYKALKDADQKIPDDKCEITKVNNIENDEIIYVTGKQFIVSYTYNQLTGKLENRYRTFGDDFNFVWPRLAPGNNIFLVEGGGDGNIKFTYRYPMKVGDCAMNIDTYGNSIECCDVDMQIHDTIKWENITGTPTSLSGYGITDAYTVDQVYKKSEVYNKKESYHKNDLYTRSEVDDKIDDIEISGGTGSGYGTIDEEELNNMLDGILG